ncbi:MAG: GNAT family N-acetyltransferase [Oscillospiraceae bacterium]|jgi:ribosomal protein S18 acetylase RimI-like enzyme|nr:GNAT family N-acetyltransferase [Oscillospiraceae bacterium]
MRPLTNNYLLAADVRRLAGLGLLERVSVPGADFLFERRGGYVKLHFRVSDASARLPPRTETVVASFVYRSAPDPGISGWLTAQGFEHSASRLRLEAERLVVSPAGKTVTAATREEADDLFGSAFDKLTADLPSEYGALLAVRDENGAAAGILHAGSPRYIAVRPEYRGQGIASALYSAYAASGAYGGGVLRAWVAERNPAARALYAKLGFEPDGYRAEYYVLSPR